MKRLLSDGDSGKVWVVGENHDPTHQKDILVRGLRCVRVLIATRTLREEPLECNRMTYNGSRSYCQPSAIS